jgi:hypothetical protein
MGSWAFQIWTCALSPTFGLANGLAPLRTTVARIVLHIDPSQHPERARRVWESHLARAKWMTQHGYEHLLRGDNAETPHE